MKKRRLSVRIEGVWYRVSHGKLHKINREVTAHGGRSDAHPHNAKAFNINSSPTLFDEAFVDENMKQLSYKKAKGDLSIFSSRQSMHVTPPEATSEGHPMESEMSSGIDGLCSFVGGKPQGVPSQELEDSGQVSDGGDSSMSTATSARKPLVIRIKFTKVIAQ